MLSRARTSTSYPTTNASLRVEQDTYSELLFVNVLLTVLMAWPVYGDHQVLYRVLSAE